MNVKRQSKQTQKQKETRKKQQAFLSRQTITHIKNVTASHGDEAGRALSELHKRKLQEARRLHNVVERSSRNAGRNSGRRGKGSNSTATRSSIKKKSIVMHDASGMRVGQVHVAQTLNDYRRMTNVPVTKAKAHHTVEHHSVKRGNYHTTCQAHFLLASLSTSSVSAMGVGERFNDGIAVLNPHNLGGRLQLLAEQFEFHDIKKVELHYAPAVPTTTPGSIVIYAPGDPTIDQRHIGLTEKSHAATFDNYSEFPVWEESTLKLELEHNKAYYDDEADTDSRLSVQGQVIIEAGSDLAADTTYGTVYARVECEFWQAALEPQVPTRQRATITITWDTVTYSTLVDQVIVAGEGGATGAGTITFVSITEAAASFPQDDFIFCGSVIETTGTTPSWYTIDQMGGIIGTDFEVGQGIYSHIRPFAGSPTTGLCLYTNYDAATNAYSVSNAGSGGQEDATVGQLVYFGLPSGAQTGTVELEGFYTKLGLT